MLQVLAGTQSNDTTSNIQGSTSNILDPTSNIHNLPNISENPPSISEDVGIRFDAQDFAGSIEVPSSNTDVPPSNTDVPPSNTDVPPSNTDVPPSETKSQEAWEKRSEDSLSSDSGLRTPVDCRGRLKLVLTSTPCQVVVVVLVVVDAVVVVGELLLDLGENTRHSSASKILHIVSLALLSLFFFELLLKIYTFRLELLSHKAEVIDGVVVVVALCLDAVYLNSHDAHSGLGLIIVLRLWRLVRIQNATLLQARRVYKNRVKEERQRRLAVEQQLQESERVVGRLQQLLHLNNINYQDECSQ